MAEYKYVTVSEAFDVLSKQDQVSETEKEAMAYVEKFHSLKASEVKKAHKALKEIGSLPERVMVKILDLLPKNKESLVVILNSYSLNLSDEKLDKIVDLVKGLVE